MAPRVTSLATPLHYHTAPAVHSRFPRIDPTNSRPPTSPRADRFPPDVVAHGHVVMGGRYKLVCVESNLPACPSLTLFTFHCQPLHWHHPPASTPALLPRAPLLLPPPAPPPLLTSTVYVTLLTATASTISLDRRRVSRRVRGGVRGGITLISPLSCIKPISSTRRLRNALE